MDNEQKKYLQSFARSARMYETVRDFVLDFGIIDVDSDCTDLELGSRMRAREEMKRELIKKFNTISFLVDED